MLICIVFWSGFYPPLLLPPPSSSCTVSCWNQCESLHVFRQVFKWQNAERLSFIFGLVTWYYYIYDELSFCYTCGKSISVDHLFWYLTGSCVVAHLTPFFFFPRWLPIGDFFLVFFKCQLFFNCFSLWTLRGIVSLFRLRRVSPRWIS